MRKSRFLRLTLAAAFVAFLACSGGDDEAGSAAAATVRTFYDHLNSGSYGEAKELYTEETRQQIFPDSEAAAGFREWALSETRNGRLTAFEVVGEAQAGDGITVEFELRFSDGESVRRQVTVTDEGGAWRLGTIG